MPDLDIFNGLDGDFVAKLKALLQDCADRGVVMKPYFGLRDPLTQGKLWRRSRVSIEIASTIDRLRTQGANFLADSIEKAPATTGPWATNAIPGESWHQYGEAMDCAWIRNGAMCWSTTLDGNKNGYLIYMGLAEKHGLTAIGKTMHRDFGHVQLRPQGAPDQLYGLLQIDGMMKEKFGQAGIVRVSDTTGKIAAKPGKPDAKSVKASPKMQAPAIKPSEIPEIPEIPEPPKSSELPETS